MNKFFVSPNRATAIAVWLLLFVIAAIYALTSCWTSVALDDWMFMSEWNNVNGEKDLGISTLFDFWKRIRIGDNGRLANVASPMFSLFSPWKYLFPIITGLWVAFIILASSVIAFGRKLVNLLTLSGLWFGLILVLPWRNQLFVNDYSLNYIWGAGLTLAFMLYVVKMEKAGWNDWTLIGGLLIAFIAGGWHEGFAVATICGFLLLTIVRGGRFSRSWYAVGIFYGLVTIFFYLCPGMLHRTAREMGAAAIGASPLKLVIDFFPVGIAVFMILAAVIIPAYRRAVNPILRSRWFVICLGTMLAGSLLSLIFTHQPRSVFWPDLMAILIIFMLLRPLFSACSKSIFNYYLALILTCCCLLPFSAILPWQYKFYQESNEILEMMESEESGTVFYDLIPQGSVPAHALNVARNNVWVSDYQYRALKEFNGKDFPAVVPTELDLSSYEIRSSWHEKGKLFQIGQSLMHPRNLVREPETKVIRFHTIEGEWGEAPAVFIPYQSRDGIPHTYVYLISDTPVDDIRFIDF